MIDPTTIPVLVKTLDWLFGEGSKILQERRERRQAEHQTIKLPTETIAPATVTDDRETIRSQEDALKQPIVEGAWLESVAKFSHLLSLLDIYAKNYYLAKEEYARWGSALVPQIIMHNLAEAEDNVSATIKELEIILSHTYEKKVFFAEAGQKND